MLIALILMTLYLGVIHILSCLPQLLAPISVLFVTFAGIMMLLSVFGMTFSTNIVPTMLGGLFSAIGYIFRTTVEGISWIVRTTFGLIPTVYRNTRNFFSERGLSDTIATAIATIVVIIFIIII